MHRDDRQVPLLPYVVIGTCIGVVSGAVAVVWLASTAAQASGLVAAGLTSGTLAGLVYGLVARWTRR